MDTPYDPDSDSRVWTEIKVTLSAPCSSCEEIDDALRSYLATTTAAKAEHLHPEDYIAHCVLMLCASNIFTAHADYVRRQFVHVLLQEDDPGVLYLVAAFLMFDGKSNEPTFEMMQEEGIFPRLLELIMEWDSEKNPPLQRMLLILLYEMARMQRLTWDDLGNVSDTFILTLLSIIESVSNDVSDPYHYSVIRVLLVLNEQYMVLGAAEGTPGVVTPLTNRVLKALWTHAATHKTFGENLILLLNRESETSLQLLILKLLYLVFTTPTTAEYFYTNDLHVLLDVILRNLLDLPDDDGGAGSNGTAETSAGETTPHGSPMRALRHTYLRVLHPLLANSQLRRPGMAYKRAEILQVLDVVAGGGMAAAAAAASSAHVHFAPADETTVRLAERCRRVEWVAGEAEGSGEAAAVGDGAADGSETVEV